MGFNILDKDGNHVGWTASEFANDSDLQFIDDTLEIMPNIDALKSNKVAQIKEQAGQLLAGTDWQLRRATERDRLGVALLESETPKAILAYREAVRRASNRAESELALLDNADDINDFTWQATPVDYPENTAITHLQFLRRFTGEERAAISALALQNPHIADYVKMLDVAVAIHLNDPDVATGVYALEVAGVIVKGRAIEILSPPAAAS